MMNARAAGSADKLHISMGDLVMASLFGWIFPWLYEKT